MNFFIKRDIPSETSAYTFLLTWIPELVPGLPVEDIDYDINDAQHTVKLGTIKTLPVTHVSSLDHMLHIRL